ncbi:MAG: hypothetical protein K5928_08915 [Prevotella sp.]|nr:hypothetical protein [Prevotella sp.]
MPQQHTDGLPTAGEQRRDVSRPQPLRTRHVASVLSGKRLTAAHATAGANQAPLPSVKT